MTITEIILTTIIIAFLTFITIRMFQKDKITPSTGEGITIISEPDKPHGPAEPDNEV